MSDAKWGAGASISDDMRTEPDGLASCDCCSLYWLGPSLILGGLVVIMAFVWALNRSRGHGTRRAIRYDK